jgi:hypothetical protein
VPCPIALNANDSDRYVSVCEASIAGNSLITTCRATLHITRQKPYGWLLSNAQKYTCTVLMKNKSHNLIKMSRVNTPTVIGYGLDVRGSILGSGKNVTTSRQALGPAQSFIQWVLRTSHGKSAGA